MTPPQHPSPSSPRPVIAITGLRFPAGKMFKLDATLAIQSDYCDAVDRAGGLAAVLASQPLSPDDAASIVASIDGLILTGGPDVGPSRYGELPHETVYGVSEAQDGFELALLEAALEAGVPVLAICRGLQVVNVAFGGTLHQHITGNEGVQPHGIPDGGGGTPNDVNVDAATLLFDAIGTARPSGRCHHHQAVNVLGDGLAVSARTDDGIVEGVELVDRSRGWLVAVQWHPEETAASDRANQALFDSLVTHARTR